jgi:hypothetical protein
MYTYIKHIFRTEGIDLYTKVFKLGILEGVMNAAGTPDDTQT